MKSIYPFLYPLTVTMIISYRLSYLLQSCKLDPEYCQVMECDLPEGLKPNEHAEITVSLKIDKSNVPVPEVVIVSPQ